MSHHKDRDAHRELSEETQVRMMAFHRADVEGGINYKTPGRKRKGIPMTALLLVLALAAVMLAAVGFL